MDEMQICHADAQIRRDYVVFPKPAIIVIVCCMKKESRLSYRQRQLSFSTGKIELYA
ncbi:hypothetical protein MKC55_15595 [[Clostridium] innocuum]|uniref:Uncharacterized protein n=1 Tax=Clostridium innocuum TaxID=1522 RepID=A0AAP9MFA8_CLOIN|nr:hypothetical protein [[Clostridium] innocuum]MBS9794867.1 hypothetical protein [[Clostridium] innocuum]MBU9115858.1 hypothetical protein [[Clostridium] innocuum]MCH1945084.1 hypothetical protein [[Clostridium] innocuum]MCH1955967.1 hypothetical protein [[Clostridium] innocuum]MCI2985013.1 hypothetical protein [[Clostridium] innocuum]